MGLPVLRLPSLVFDNIYQSLDVSDKVLLSQCSRRVRDLVSSQEGPRTGRQVAICFNRDNTTVQVLRRLDDDSWPVLFTLRIYAARDRVRTDEKSFFTLNIDGTTWDVKKCPPKKKCPPTTGKWHCVSEKGSHEKDVLTIVKMLRNLLNCSISHISLLSTNVNFQKLFVETDALHRADNIYVHEHQFAPEVMDFMFDHFVTNYLYFWGYSGPEYSYQKPLNFPKIFLAHATWVNLENVFEMIKTSKHVELYEAKHIADKDINQLIKWWLTSDNKTLETFRIARGHPSRNLPQPPGVEVRMNRTAILEGIETTPGKKKRDEATKNIPCYLEWENGVDIIRKDGVRATLFVDHLTFYDEFVIAVWYHPNPNVDE